MFFKHKNNIGYQSVAGASVSQVSRVECDLDLDLVSTWRKTRRQGHQKRKLRMYWAKNGIIAWLIR